MSTTKEIQEAKKQDFDKRLLKKKPEELIGYLQFKRRGSMPDIEKGKGSKYNRNKEKRKLLSDDLL